MDIDSPNNNNDDVRAIKRKRPNTDGNGVATATGGGGPKAPRQPASHANNVATGSLAAGPKDTVKVPGWENAMAKINFRPTRTVLGNLVLVHSKFSSDYAKRLTARNDAARPGAELEQHAAGDKIPADVANLFKAPTIPAYGLGKDADSNEDVVKARTALEKILADAAKATLAYKRAHLDQQLAITKEATIVDAYANEFREALQGTIADNFENDGSDDAIKAQYEALFTEFRNEFYSQLFNMSLESKAKARADKKERSDRLAQAANAKKDVDTLKDTKETIGELVNTAVANKHKENVKKLNKLLKTSGNANAAASSSQSNLNRGRPEYKKQKDNEHRSKSTPAQHNANRKQDGKDQKKKHQSQERNTPGNGGGNANAKTDKGKGNAKP